MKSKKPAILVCLCLISASLGADNLDNEIKAAILRSRPQGYSFNRFQSSNISLVQIFDEITYGDLQPGLVPDSLKEDSYRAANCTDIGQPKEMSATVKTSMISETQMSRAIETTQDLAIEVGVPIAKLMNFGIKESLRQTVKISSQESQKTSREDSATITANYTVPPKTVFFLIANRSERSYSAPFSGRALIEADVDFELQRGNTKLSTRGAVPLSTWLDEASRTFEFSGTIKGIGLTGISERTNTRPVNPADPNDCVPVPAR